MDEMTLTTLAGPAPVSRPFGRLANKVCLVTGGASGIGRAAALRMAHEGAAAVVIGGRRQALGDAVAEELRAVGTESLFLATDVTQEADAERLVATVVQRFGRLDAAFNNAGFQEKRAALAEQTDAVYAQVFDTNVRAIFHCLRHMCVCPAGHVLVRLDQAMYVSALPGSWFPARSILLHTLLK